MGGRGGNDMRPGGRIVRLALERRGKLLANRLRDRGQMAQGVGGVAPGLRVVRLQQAAQAVDAGLLARVRQNPVHAHGERFVLALGVLVEKLVAFLADVVLQLGERLGGVSSVRSARVQKDAADLFDPAIPLGGGRGGPGQHPPDADAVLGLVLKSLQLLDVGLLDLLRIVQRQQILGRMNLDPTLLLVERLAHHGHGLGPEFRRDARSLACIGRAGMRQADQCAEKCPDHADPNETAPAVASAREAVRRTGIGDT